MAQVVHHLLPRTSLDKRKGRLESSAPAKFNRGTQLRHFPLDQVGYFRDLVRSQNDAGALAQFLEIRRETFRRLIKWLQVTLVAGYDETALPGLGVLYDGFQLLKPGDSIPPNLLTGAHLDDTIPEPKCGQRRAGNHGGRDEKNA
jgi:hypothetical protein